MAEMFGRYRIDSVLGEGGMGEVFEAYDTRNERTVALKRLRPWLADSGEYRARFQRESRTAARLASPHIVPIHDVGEIDGRLYIDMRLVRGRDLAQTIAETGPLTPARAAGIVDQVADALHAAHADGLVHRDVKPSNVLLADTGESGRDFAYLVDFGVAKPMDGTGTSLTGTGTAVGTMAYMAPELFLGQEIDRRVDVYALACMAHETLTGRPPFTADGPALMYKHLSAEVPRATSLRPDLPAATDEVLARGMAKERSSRYGTAPEFAAALSAALTGSVAAPAVPPSAPTRTQNPSAPPTSGPVSGPTPVENEQTVRYAGAGPYASGPPAGHPPYGGYGPGTPPPGMPGPMQVPHPSGPQGPWYPPTGPGGPVPPRRRTHPALIITLAVLGTIVIGFSALVGIGIATGGGSSPTPTPSAEPTPAPTSAPSTSASGATVTIPNAEADLARLREVFTIGPECTPVPAEYASYVSLASIGCTDAANQATVYYDIWPDAAAATRFLQTVSGGRASNGPDHWSKGEARQGPYWLGGTTDNRVASVAVYEGKRYTQFVVAPTQAQVSAAFSATSGLDVSQVTD